MTFFGNKRKNRIERMQGYTLVELVVVIAVVTLLSSGAVLGVGRLVGNAYFQKQNNIARALYVAAQNQMTEYEANGTLTMLKNRFSNIGSEEGVVKVADQNHLLFNLKNGFTQLTLDDIWEQAKIASGGADAGKYRGTIMGVTLTADDYRAYMSGSLAAYSPCKAAAFDLFASYIYDPSLLNAAICIEFSPEAGQVFSVFYCTGKQQLSYSPGSDNSVLNRGASYRQSHKIGYYGVDTLAKDIRNDLKKPEFGEVLLKNEDTLYLKFNLEKVSEARTSLMYDITVFDSPEEVEKDSLPKLQIQLDGRKLQNNYNDASRTVLSCPVYRYDEDGNTTEYTYDIAAWVDEEEYIHVVLDAADLDATSLGALKDYEALNGNEKQEFLEIRDTLSFHRFGIDTENIYCTVQGYGGGYPVTDVKKSNTENTYFGSLKVDKTASGTSVDLNYSIHNLRHLYNVRYLEDGMECVKSAGDSSAFFASEEVSLNHYYENVDHITYTVAEDLDFSLFELYSSSLSLNSIQGRLVSGEQKVFPSILRLRSGSTIEGECSKEAASEGNPADDGGDAQKEADADSQSGEKETDTRVVISSLVISSEQNQVYIHDRDPGDSAGFILTNYGTIRNLALEEISVTGVRDAGAFCGRSYGGCMEKLTVADSSSSISGRCNVGGIAGYVAGSDASQNRDIVYQELVNYGTVTEAEGSASEEDPCNFGGIFGCIENIAEKSNNADTGVLQIQRCSNYGAVAALTHKDSDYNGPGAENLGGIVGKAAAELKEDGNSNVALEDCTAVLSDMSTGALADAEKDSLKKACYVGGVIGYSEGAALYGCNVQLPEGVSEGCVYGDAYVGGLAGYNNGVIMSGKGAAAKSIECSADVCGNRYTGGIVGYNGIDSIVSGYTMSGDVTGTEYVGGFAGLNTSVNLLMNEDGTARIAPANSGNVVGQGYVGGMIGANMIPTDRDIITGFNSAQITGAIGTEEEQITKRFAGGMIGYNCLLDASVLAEEDQDAVRQTISKAADQAADALQQIQDQTEVNTKETRDKLLPAFYIGDAVNKVNALIIEGNSEQNADAASGSVSAEMYVGGVLGYNEEETHLTVRNVVNSLSVTAFGHMLDRSGLEQKNTDGTARTYGEDNQFFTYSYVGGIIGKVGNYSVLENCRNASQAVIKSDGTYLGSLCEINAGLIRECRVSDFGSSERSHVGGIAGLNQYSDAKIVYQTADGEEEHQGGTICNTEFTDATISGHAYVGGIASENFGTILDTGISNALIEAQNDYVGAVTGYNHPGASIIQQNVMTESVMHVKSPEGTYVGGFAGFNEDAKLDNLKISAESTVLGKEFTGGFAGYLYCQDGVGAIISNFDVKGLQNRGTVTANETNAGGIAGGSNVNVEDCVNYGTVSALGVNGVAGGLIAENLRRVADCYNYGLVQAEGSSGICGGIVGVNQYFISNCSTNCVADVYGTRIDYAPSAVLPVLEYRNTWRCGGIVGLNGVAGTVMYCSADKLLITDDSDSSQECSAGILVGENRGGLYNGQVTGSKIVTGRDGSRCGGVVGWNLPNASVWYTTVKSTELHAENNIASDLGGIIGYNQGWISGDIARADIYGGTGSEDHGYGGIAGKNDGTIMDCSYSGMDNAQTTVRRESLNGVFHGVIAYGDPQNPANIGGIAGVNTVNGGIKNCFIGVDYATVIAAGTSKGSYGNLGGLCGLNCGTIQDCDNAAGNTKQVQVIGFGGQVGGIAGRTEEGGVVTGSDPYHLLTTGSNWTVDLYPSTDSDCVGGVTGFYGSGNSVSYVINYASVRRYTNGNYNTPVGGLIGRYENRTNEQAKIEDCSNYGNVRGEGSSVVGGLIGESGYEGADLIGLSNYGRAEGPVVGGILGGFSDAGRPCLIGNCTNYGSIKGDLAAGGILGGESVDRTTAFSGCVNVGCVEGKNAAAGIAAAMGTNATYYRCRNYGNAKKAPAFVGIANDPGEMTQCLNLSNQTMKLSNVETAGESNFILYESDKQEASLPETTYALRIVSEGRTYRLEGNGLVLEGLYTNPALLPRDNADYYAAASDMDHANGVHQRQERNRQRVYEEVDGRFMAAIENYIPPKKFLDVPDVDLLYSNLYYAPETCLDWGYLEEEGMLLTYPVIPGTDDEQVETVEIAVAVYDTYDEATAQIADQQDWAAGSRFVLIPKAAQEGENSVDMLPGEDGYPTYNLKDASAIDGGFSSELAGKWLKIAIRLRNEKGIYSAWSDQDDTYAKNYQWIRIPRVRMKTSDISIGNHEQGFDIAGDTQGIHFTALQRDVTLDLPEYADSHLLTIVHQDTTSELLGTNKFYTATYVDWIYLDRKENGYDFYYATTASGFDPNQQDSYGNPVYPYRAHVEGIPEMVLIDPGMIPYDVLLQIDEQYTLIMGASMSLQEDGSKLYIQLPDVESIYERPGKAAFTTRQLQIQSFVSDEYAEVFENSLIATWYEGQTEVPEPLRAYAEGPSIGTPPEVSLSDREDAVYELSQMFYGGAVLYRITLPESLGGRVYYVSAHCYTEDQYGYEAIALLDPLRFDLAFLPGDLITVETALILPQGGGVTGWSAPVMVPVPEKPLEEPEEEDSDTDELDDSAYEDGWIDSDPEEDIVIPDSPEDEYTDPEDPVIDDSGIVEPGYDEWGEYVPYPEDSYPENDTYYEESPVIVPDVIPDDPEISEDMSEYPYDLDIVPFNSIDYGMDYNDYDAV